MQRDPILEEHASVSTRPRLIRPAVETYMPGAIWRVAVPFPSQEV